jgi:hypothetical protein
MDYRYGMWGDLSTRQVITRPNESASPSALTGSFCLQRTTKECTHIPVVPYLANVRSLNILLRQRVFTFEIRILILSSWFKSKVFFGFVPIFTGTLLCQSGLLESRTRLISKIQTQVMIKKLQHHIRPTRRAPKLQEKPPTLQKKHQLFKTRSFFIFSILWAIFIFQDPGLDPQYNTIWKSQVWTFFFSQVNCEFSMRSKTFI